MTVPTRALVSNDASYTIVDLAALGLARLPVVHRILIENLLADPQQHLSDSSFLTADETMGLSSADFPESGLSQKDFESLILQLNSSSSLK